MKAQRWVVGGITASAILAAAVGGCASKHDDDATLPRDQLLDPKTCGSCHKEHYDEWSGSMHAYAAEDPVFLALNKRMQRETNGALGDFCIRCHAPMAVRDGLTKDGLNLAALPQKYRGVTCFFCHTTESVGEMHNNGLVPGDDAVMRGPFGDAIKNSAHRSAQSVFHNQTTLESSSLCGSCHDIVTPSGAPIERTFQEWKASVFSHGATGQTCGQCHMRPASGVKPIADVPGARARVSHPHHFAGVDRALTPWPNMDQQKTEIQYLLDSSIQASLCLNVRGTSARYRVVLDNVFAGHTFPSGSSQDRRAWVEIVGKKGDQVVYQTGVAEDGKLPDDPDLWLLRDHVYDQSGKETPLFGLAACSFSQVLPFPTTSDMADPDFYRRNIVKDFPKTEDVFLPAPDTATLRLRILPVGYEVLDELIGTGDLDPALRSKFETMQVGPTVTWTFDTAQQYVERDGTEYRCVTVTNQNFAANKYPPPERTFPENANCGH